MMMTLTFKETEYEMGEDGKADGGWCLERRLIADDVARITLELRDHKEHSIYQLLRGTYTDATNTTEALRSIGHLVYIILMRWRCY